MPFGSQFASYLAALVFTADTIPGIADNAASSPITSIELGLHTGSPASGNQTTSEATYTSYARVAVARAVSDYTETGAGVVENDDPIVWPKATGGSSTVTHVSCGTAHSGSGVVLVSGSLTASLVVSNGVVPSIAIAGMSVTVDITNTNTMNPLTLRKLILVGIQGTSTAPVLDARGMPASPVEQPVKMRIAMWIPQSPPFQRRGVEPNPNPPPRDRLQDPLEGYTLVTGILPHELQALRDGAIVEEIFDFEYPKQPTLDTLRRELMPIWEMRTMEVLGYVPSGAPVDRDPKPELRFTAI